MRYQSTLRPFTSEYARLLPHGPEELRARLVEHALQVVSETVDPPDLRAARRDFYVAWKQLRDLGVDAELRAELESAFALAVVAALRGVASLWLRERGSVEIPL